MKRDLTRIDRLAKIGLLSSLALVLSYLETMVPLPVALPGVKLGLANVAVVVALFAMDWKSAAAVATAKVVASGLLFGSPVMLAYSLGGMALAFAGMLALRAIPGVGAVAVSMAAAMLHNAGQLAVAAAMLQNPAVIINLAPLGVAALVTGLLTGVVAAQAIASVSPAGGRQGVSHFAKRLVMRLSFGETTKLCEKSETRKARKQREARDSHVASQGSFSFGVFRPGCSFVHRLDPRTKIIFSLLYIVAAFAASGAIGMAAIAVVAIVAHAFAGFGVQEARRALKPFGWLMAFIVVFDCLFVSSGEILLAWGVVCVSAGGIAFAAESVVRFACMLLATSMLMATTSPTQLTDAISALLAPLRRVGVHVDDVALVLGLTLRFIPTFSDELSRIKKAQASRCANFEDGSWARRVVRLATLATPLLASALRKSTTLAASIASRAYGAMGMRTCARAYRMGPKDWAALAFSTILMLACCVI